MLTDDLDANDKAPGRLILLKLTHENIKILNRSITND